MGSCQNYGPLLGTLNIRCRIILRPRTQQGTMILTTALIGATKIGGAICCCRIAEVHIALWPAAILWKHPPGSSQAGTAGEHWAANAGNCGIGV